MKKLLWILLFCGSMSLAYSQTESEQPLRSIFSSTMLTLGRGQLYETYLTPIRYSGLDIGLSNERLQIARYGKGRFTAQQMISISYTSATNPTGNGRMLSGFIDYGYGTHYTFKPVRSLSLLAGGQIDGVAGFIYNLRNSNNLASAKVNVNLSLSGMAIYRLNIGKLSLIMRYQAVIPFAGLFFAPQYGESYYEIFRLENTKEIVHFGSFHNQFNMTNLFTVDLPVRRFNLRVGYQNVIRTTHVNSIRTQIYDNRFILGVSTEFVPLKRGRNEQVKQSVVRAFY